MGDARQVDLLVVGAGILGLASALAARRRGLRVAVLERRARSLGASIRNFGFVTVSGQGPAAHWERARRSRAVWEEVAAAAGIPILQRGAWFLAQRPEAAAVLEAFAASEMGRDCRLISPDRARQDCPALAEGCALLHSPHECRVESRLAIPRLTQWLVEQQGVTLHAHTAVHEIDLPRVRTSRGLFHATHCIVCPGHDFDSLHPEWLEGADLQICTLQMLRLQPQPALPLPCPLMSDLSLARYPGFTALAPAAALQQRLARECPEPLAAGVHVIAARSADGSLVVGDSHHHADAEEPFAREAVDALILAQLQQMLRLPQARVVERWMGSYASAREPVLLRSPAPGVALGIVTGGTGASTAFALGEELVERCLNGA